MDDIKRMTDIVNACSDSLLTVNDAAEKNRKSRDKSDLRDMVERHGQLTIAQWLHEIIHEKPLNLSCSNKCRDGRVVTGRMIVTAYHTAPCPNCRAVEHTAYMKSDPMSSDEAAFDTRSGTGVRRSWAGD